MLEFLILGAFAATLLTCIVLDVNILYALVLGYLYFCSYGLIRKFTVIQLLKMSAQGIKKIKNILIVFVLIGMITAIWRACGTIPFIIYHASGFIVPSAFVLVTFLLCCLISVLTGTAFGTAATMGVICMTLANTMAINPVFVGGAILSGIYFGDRCSPMSTSALLVSELTGTDIYRNIKNMVRTAAVPFVIACAVYLLMGMRQQDADVPQAVWDLFSDNFNLHPVVVLPAVLIIVLCMLRIKVKYAMLASALAGCVIAVLVQGTPLRALAVLLLSGFQAGDSQLAVMMNGGGLASMVRVGSIVCLSSCYAGIFDGTGLLSGIKDRIAGLSDKITPFGCILVTSVITGMVACNQTLTIMLTHQLCKETVPDEERLAVHLENAPVVIAPLIPWSIAGAMPLAAVGAPTLGILAACYLYLIPLWNLVFQGKKRADKQTCPADGGPEKQV